jgi:hypothetical protein
MTSKQAKNELQKQQKRFLNAIGITPAKSYQMSALHKHIQTKRLTETHKSKKLKLSNVPKTGKCTRPFHLLTFSIHSTEN